MKIKINNVKGFQPGTTKEIKTVNGVPVERFWRRRLADSKIDNCIEVIKPRKPKPAKSEDKS